jgi:glutamyl-Q tRNA(Asp) synthetase
MDANRRYIQAMIVTRFAPSPTGFLHLGHAFAAIAAFESGDDLQLRIEDIDRGRSRENFIEAIFFDLKWLGLSWNEPVLRQSRRLDAYKTAVARLEAQGLVYPCFCSRREIAEEIARAKAAPQGPEGPVYPGTCRALGAGERAARQAAGQSYALRLDAQAAARRTGPLTFTEHGHVRTVDPLYFGDAVIGRKDMPACYHLAVTVDDAFQNVTLVTRGEDLLPSTHIQRVLQALLDLPEPAYAHHRLILDEKGRKFSKRDGAVTLAALREKGATPSDIRARIGA